eukprot:4419223-Prorocentrum_lima.AAC.1
MTSSLVGSEMCIRDSHNPGTGTLGYPRVVFAPATAGPNHRKSLHARGVSAPPLLRAVPNRIPPGASASAQAR